METVTEIRIECACCGGTGELTGAEALRPYRLLAGVSIKELASEMRLSTSFIGLAERGDRKQGRPDFHRQFLAAVDRVAARRQGDRANARWAQEART